METSTHILFGVGIASLASLDPNLQEYSLPVYVSCVLASNAPDFDYALKLKGKSEYYKLHRGFSHSLIMLPLWAFMITAGIALIYPDTEFLQHLFLWNLGAVIVHVLTDLLNFHGTQVFRPFTEKWFSFDCVPLFDYFIFLLHISGMVVSLIGFHPGKTFLAIYLLMFIYILLRFAVRSYIYHQLTAQFLKSKEMKILPNMDLYSWQVIIECEEYYILGRYTWGEFVVDSVLQKETSHSWIEISKQNKDISNFITSTIFIYPRVIERKEALEVRWIDLRFRKGRRFPFKAIWVFSHHKSLEKSYVGWFHHPTQYKRIKKELVNEVSK
ncbi:metal-dependent hydrolase [Rossellomorea aquimaris]|nr:metal-dependent hydrolase [Rossellomorea aquimaris]WRP04992.1 metal-dependent hydrolase [Rossellomorea aquimaris]